MSTSSIRLEVITPKRTVLNSEVTDLQLPSSHRGYYGILAEHASLMTPLKNGVLHFLLNGKKHALTIFDGFAEVGTHHVVVVARESESFESIDALQAQQAKIEALATLKQATSEGERANAQRSLEIAQVRLDCCEIASAPNR